MKADSFLNKLKPSLVALATTAYLWFSILALLLAIVLLHIPNASCTSVAGPRSCIPQYKIRFLEVPDRDQDILQGAKGLLRLLSYVAVDLNANGKAAASADYDDVNLVNTFNPSNYFKINHLGYCKEQPSVTKIPCYCTNNLNGLEPISMLVRDVGVQFGITSSKNPYMMGNSFVYAFKLGLRALMDAGKATGTNSNDNDNIFAKYLNTGSESDNDVPARDFSQWQGVAELLTVLQNLCWSVSFISLIEFSLCFLIVISTVITAPAALTGRQRKKRSKRVWRSVDTWGCIALKVLPIFTAIVSFFGVFMSSVLYSSLTKASATHGLSKKYYELQVGDAFYLNVARLALECALVWQTLKFNKHKNKTENDPQMSPASLENWPKDLEMDSILSSSTTV
ncbi:LAME_0E08856g1_1 [Lachancea meyersii CBS 8951]|uniref:LAME_0E08856g1_1 n=1 Tax=Lachancea meyersii CBS 8951 TaxID=1266667 RepID=A0A1G4JJ49_9SACH|nr:LAME_0E08856g1_1 [Lachancea meyersii CBS 8951]